MGGKECDMCHVWQRAGLNKVCDTFCCKRERERERERESEDIIDLYRGRTISSLRSFDLGLQGFIFCNSSIFNQ
jgi:hypothetical protein